MDRAGESSLEVRMGIDGWKFNEFVLYISATRCADGYAI